MVGQQQLQYHKYHHWLLDRGDLLRSNARFLKLKLKDRLRVAVDRHFYDNLPRPRPLHSLSSSPSLQRCLDRVRSFLRLHSPSSSSPSSSSPSSSVFSRRRVAKDIYAEDETAITRTLQALAVPVLGNVCHVFMHGLNRVQIYGAEKLHEVLQHRAKDKPLITVSNHVASVDDPLVIAALLPPRVLMDARNLRWTLCATDRCFKNPVTSAFFRSVKVLPVARGDGIYQEGLDMAIAKLNIGGWVHIFPEGSRSRDGGKTLQSAKRGVGRLVVDADKTPIVIPFVHTGMQDIMPIGAKFPRIGKIVTVLVGDPIEFNDLLDAEGTGCPPRGNLYDAVSSRIGDRLQVLKVQVDRLALEQSRKMKNLALEGMDRATGMWQQVDWESFGMNGYLSREDDNTILLQQEGNTEGEAVSQRENSVSDKIEGDGFIRDGGILSRTHTGDLTKLMGFAARGLFQNRASVLSKDYGQLNPVRTWKQFLEANCGTTVQLC